MKKEFKTLKQNIDDIRIKLLNGKISYDEAKVLMKPFIDKVNAEGELIAKKHGIKYKKITFTGIIR